MKRYRKNVAILLKYQEIYLACLRSDTASWQCVQGGLEENDASVYDAIYREICEELGVDKSFIHITYCSTYWRRYEFPDHFVKSDMDAKKAVYSGQDQLWFCGTLKSLDAVCLGNTVGEFQDMKCVTLKELLSGYSPWKKAPLLDFCKESGLTE